MAKPNNNTLFKNCVEPFLPDMSGSGGHTVLYATTDRKDDDDKFLLYKDPEFTIPVLKSELKEIFLKGPVMISKLYNTEQSLYDFFSVVRFYEGNMTFMVAHSMDYEYYTGE